ncbi:60S ribosomal protein L37a [Plasmodium yoelii 17X]|uniref:60S ribosomal protein L37ae n=3 Tax=Plasmodium yoelii TaxID=5861 RepID=A0AAF0B1L1_PLAYO|nr:60S ribosomal protein L37ae, putative [Plasmodium yoelii]ETB57117.1 60S ribosomal protein L37a [Plasmodium yoelii 17X]WBY54991.1 60S ribosomal protein L37ae [Plasmodium yoelii yoelii]CDU16263.1 60S ribosomal protein L37ae, putative [Plasmodium yoelii]VTZ72484.1 60S ribosomal protein L37ae, putative [Plasmodium yoelii]|eukprot:XP_022811449.1 60S ribosomal protein L37ae, putative [Plasmodium yoelii]
MSRRTKKVGLTGKYGTRYGSSLRKQIKKIELMQHAKYLCSFCGKTATKRTCVGIWECKKCKRKTCGGAWSLTTPAAVAAKSTIIRLRKQKEEAHKS